MAADNVVRFSERNIRMTAIVCFSLGNTDIIEFGA